MHLWSIGTVVLATGLILFFDWVPTPLNRNISKATVRDRLIGDLVHVPIGALMVLALVQQWRWVVLAGAIWYSFVLVMAVINWWVPWLSGITIGEITPDVYAREYATNLRVLPRRARSPIVPDVQHTLIHLAVLAAAGSSWVAFADLA